MRSADRVGTSPGAPRALAAAAVLLLAAGAGVAQTWRGQAGLEVRVASRKDGNLAGARVELLYRGGRESGGPPAVATDANGRALILGLAPGTWQVEVTHPNYMSYVAVVQLDVKEKPQITASFLEATETASAPIQVKLGKARGGPASAPLPESASRPESSSSPRPRPEPAAPRPPTTSGEQQPAAPAAAPTEPARPAPTPAKPEPPVQSAPPKPQIEEPQPTPSAPAEPAPAGSAPESVGSTTVEPAPEPPKPERQAPERPAPEQPAPEPPAPEPPAPEPPAPEPPAPEPPAPEPPAPEPPAPEQPAPERPISGQPAPERPAPTPPRAEPTPAAPAAPQPPAPAAPAPTEPPASATPPSEPERMPPPVIPEAAASAPAEAAPPSAPRPAAAPAPPLEWRSYRQRTCPECRAGEWAVTAAVDLAGSAPCSEAAVDAAAVGAAGLGGRAELELAGFAGALEDAVALVAPETARDIGARFAAAGEGCRVLAVVLPKSSRFVGFQYEVESDAGRQPCLPDQACAGGAGFAGPPRVTRGAAATIIHALAHGDRGLALMTVYFRAPNDQWAPDR